MVDGMEACRTWWLTCVLLLQASFAYAQNNVGAEKCAGCHDFEYKVWLASGHAKAHQALTDEQLKDPKCNNCHTNTTQPEAKFAGVQCEHCHGPGKFYQASYVMKDRDLARSVGLVDPTPQSCAQCHTEGAPSVAPFDFKTMWARIDHGKEARAAWEAARGKAK